MPDITMCLNKECPLQKLCYRAQATPSQRQSYSVFKPKEKGKGAECDHFQRNTRSSQDEKNII